MSPHVAIPGNQISPVCPACPFKSPDALGLCTIYGFVCELDA